MTPEQYEHNLVTTAIMVTAFLLLTYGSLQILTLRRTNGWRRIVAALPLLLMVPIIISGANPKAHRDGSLFFFYFIIPYLPVMIYLATFLFLSSRISPTRAASRDADDSRIDKGAT